MNNSIFISAEKLKQLISNITITSNNIADLFDRIHTTMEKINETDIWTGTTQAAFYERYKELEKFFPSTSKGLNVYINFLNTTLDNYERAENKINQEVSNNSDKLNVN